LKNGQPAGHNTNTLPLANVQCWPLKTARGVVGVLGVAPVPAASASPGQAELVQAFVNQSALAIERVQLAEQARQAEVLQSAEQLRTALLNMISHDLRTPLVSITGALSSLQEDEVRLDEATRRSLVENARDEAERLNRLVGNLLDMTRIEAGALRVNREPCDVQDVIGAALQQMERGLAGRPVTVDAPANLPPVPLDFVLVGQVLVNLLDNALKYSADGAPVRARAWVEDGEMRFQVADRGIGIPPADLTRVLDKFYRVRQSSSVRGSGLGLSICKGIVEAHGGRIWVENREGGGTLATFTLPLV
jgi:two-component system sensor histidine kinase KdpD